MQKYTVIWRDNGDDYMITTVEVPEEQGGNMNSQEFVMAAAEVEYDGFEYKAEILEDIEENGYDLIGVIFGEAVWVY